MKKSNQSSAIKFFALFSFLLSSTLQIAIGQSVEGKTFNSKGYQAWITLEDSRVVRGLLWNVDPEKIEIKSDQIKGWKNANSNAEILNIPIERVESVRIKRVHAVLKSYGYGVLTGVAVGSLAAITFEAIEPNSGYVLLIPMGGFLGSGIGIIAGTLPGKVFRIARSKKKMSEILPAMDKKAFWKMENSKK